MRDRDMQSPVMHRPQKKKENIFPQLLLKPGSGQNHPHTRRGGIQSSFASKTVLSSSRLLVISPLVARGKFTPEAGISGWYQVPARTIGTLWAPCGQTYVEVRDDYLYNTYEYEYINVVF